MAVTDPTGIQLTKASAGIVFTKVVDDSGDHASVANDTYFFDKSIEAVLYKDSSGNIVEGYSLGGLTNWTENVNTAAPNATVPAISLDATNAASNADAIILPKGNGANIAQVPDNLTPGGNKRGQYATDWQKVRNANTRVASGNYSAIGGGQTNTASGINSTVVGGLNNNASGLGSVSGGTNNSSTNSYTTTFGNTNTASTIYATAIGFGNTASGQGAFAVGNSNQGTGVDSMALGFGNKATGGYDFAHGQYAATFNVHGRESLASGRFAVDGDCQTSKFVLRRATADATATTVTTNGNAGGTGNQVTLQNNSTYRFKGTIVGRKTGSTDTAAWDIEGLIQRAANAASTTLIVSSVTVVDNTPTWGTPTLAADTTNGGLQVQVIGLAVTDIRWTCMIETAEIIYA